MPIKTGLIFFWLSLASVGAADKTWRALASYIDLPYAAQAQALAVDAGGNIFVVSGITEPSGRPQIRVTKTDPNGVTLASIDFGGSFFDSIEGAAVDPQGNVVIAGGTNSPDFPLVSPLISKTSQGSGFVVKIDSGLRNIIFSTRLGGTHNGDNSGGSSTEALAIDAAGNIYLTGITGDTDFPVTQGAFQTKPPAIEQIGSPLYAYLTEITGDGQKIVFSTFFGADHAACFGGSGCVGAFGATGATSIALDTSGNAVIAGSTSADQLPVTPGVFGPSCGSCSSDSAVPFLAKFAAGGAQLLWATYIPVGEFSNLTIQSIALNTSGDVVFSGMTTPDVLPTTAGAFEPAPPFGQGEIGGFIATLDSGAQRLISSTYFGGAVESLALDSQGNVWITGVSPTDELPSTSDVAALSSDLSRLETLFTAPAEAAGRAIVLSKSGIAIALGSAGSLLTVTPDAGPSLVGITNSAAAEVSNAIVPFELVSIYGIGLGPSTPANNVQVLFDGVPASLLYAGPTRIDCIVPGEVQFHDTVQIEIDTPSGPLQGPPMLVRPSQPQVFTRSSPMFGANANPAAALNQDGSLNSATNPAAPGSIVSVWATGGGALNLPVAVLWQESLEVLYAGAAPGLVTGVLQINFRLPPGHDLYPLKAFVLQIGSALSDPFAIYISP